MKVVTRFDKIFTFWSKQFAWYSVISEYRYICGHRYRFKQKSEASILILYSFSSIYRPIIFDIQLQIKSPLFWDWRGLVTRCIRTSREFVNVVRRLSPKFGEREPLRLTERKSLAVALLRRNNLKSGEPGKRVLFIPLNRQDVHVSKLFTNKKRAYTVRFGFMRSTRTAAVRLPIGITGNQCQYGGTTR